MLAVHADWSVDRAKRWMALARPGPAPGRRLLSIEPVGPLGTLLQRLAAAAHGAPVALGVDFPIGLPRHYAARHAEGAPDFPTFLRRPAFFHVADTLADAAPGRPFYPRRGARGMTRLSLAHALGLPDAAALSRACDRATAARPAGAPLFWTLGANQSGKAAISGWRDLLLPALADSARPLPPPLLWPFDGPFRALLRPGRVAVAETYPADALRQLGLRPHGSKRRQADRAALIPGLRAAMGGLGAAPDPALDALLAAAFGPDPAGEDRFDCLLGVLCVLLVLAGRRPDTPPADPWLTTWEGWVLGQSE